MAVNVILDEIADVIEQAADDGRDNLTLVEEEHLIQLAARGVKECRQEDRD